MPGRHNHLESLMPVSCTQVPGSLDQGGPGGLLSAHAAEERELPVERGRRRGSRFKFPPVPLGPGPRVTESQGEAPSLRLGHCHCQRPGQPVITGMPCDPTRSLEHEHKASSHGRALALPSPQILLCTSAP